MKVLISMASIAVAVALTASCGSSKNAPTANLQAAQAKFPGYTLAEYTAGQALYTENCGRCHPAYAPSSRTEEQWGVWVPKMVPKANKKAGSVVIDETGQDLILKFLYAASH